MGTTRAIPEARSHIDSSQLLSLVPIGERILISNIETRRALVEYTTSGLRNSSFNALLGILKVPELTDYIRFTAESEISRTFISPVYPRAADVLKLFTRTESVCAIFRLSAVSSYERKLIVRLSHGELVNIKELTNVYTKMCALEIIVTSIPPSINNGAETIILNQNVAFLLTAII